jgi:hypothetical protein
MLSITQMQQTVFVGFTKSYIIGHRVTQRIFLCVLLRPFAVNLFGDPRLLFFCVPCVFFIFGDQHQS